MIKQSINKLVDGKNLSKSEMVDVMREIMSGEATSAQIGAFITALRIKGETADEITGAAFVMREKAQKIQVTSNKVVVDTCGTGGDSSSTFNISTTAAFVAAGAGLTVAKHGNRSVSSKCGSADLLKELGVNIEAGYERVKNCMAEIGIGFLFAPMLHGAMKHAIGPRREIGIRTIFNILGPLTNPAGAECQVIGVYSESLTVQIAYVLKNLGSKHVFVVHGNDGLDEITLTVSTRVSELKDGNIKTYDISPEDFGLARCGPEELKGGTSQENAVITKDILSGKKGPKRDIVLLNASAAIAAAGHADNIKDGIKIAEESIDSGAAMLKLEGLIRETSDENN